ncbi:MAG: ATP-binding protein [Eubacterium ramulus]
MNTFKHQIMVQITDNGKGMDAETLKSGDGSFYTTRTTRKVGLGIPFFKQEAECTGGSFSISSVSGKGIQIIQAVFCTDQY